MAIFNSYVCLPEGKPPFSYIWFFYDFPMFLWFSPTEQVRHVKLPEGVPGIPEDAADGRASPPGPNVTLRPVGVERKQLTPKDNIDIIYIYNIIE